MKKFYCNSEDRYVTQGQQFTLGEVTYPSNWLDHANVEDLACVGLVEVTVVGEEADDRYFDNVETLSGDTLTITQVSKPIAHVISIIWTQIKAERDRRNHAGYKVGTKWFHSDADSRIQQLGLVMMGANIPAGLQWKTMDGSFVAMTTTLAQQVFAAAAASDQAIFAAAETHKAAMEASADPASYDFSTGWPLVFGE